MEATEAKAAGKALWDVFRHVPDHREASGKRYPLPAVLCMAVAAVLTASRSEGVSLRLLTTKQRLFRDFPEGNAVRNGSLL
jgi:hypothetical protein